MIIRILLILSLVYSNIVYAINEKPIEKHGLLGQPVLMDYLTCVQKYGSDFCRCMKNDSGNTVCYYQRPPTGFYTKEECERIWGVGHCEEVAEMSGPRNWKLERTERKASGAECGGKILIFSGEKQECRSKTGMIGLGGSCCWQDTGEKCSFRNTAETLGWDSAVIDAVESATKFLADKYLRPQLTDWMNSLLGDVSQSLIGSSNPIYNTMMENAFKSAVASKQGATQLLPTTVNGAMTDLSREALGSAINISDEVALKAANAYAETLAKSGEEAAKKAYESVLVENGVSPSQASQAAGNFAELAPSSKSILSDAISGAAITGVISIGFSLLDGKLTAQELQDAAISMVVAFANTFVPGVSWAYMAYKMYNMLTAETECLPFEYTLACKVGEGLCHYVGERCTSKVFGHCVGKKKVYCCFKSVLARVVNEQGRKQIGKDWGDAESPKCEGFTPQEFAQLDFSKMDLSEFTKEIQRRTNVDMQNSIENAIKRFQQNLQ